MQTQDTNITDFIGRDNLSPVMKHIEEGVDRLHSRLSTLTAFVSGGALGSAALGWVGQFSKDAQKAASDFETLRAQLEAFTGSAQAAQAKIKLAEIIAIPSSFTSKQLGEAAVQLEALQINSDRALPSLARLGQAFNADEEHLRMLVRIFGDFSIGKVPDIDQLAPFGLSRGQLQQAGIQFDPQGKLLSSATDAMNKLETFINTRYGRIFEAMANTPAARAASAQDAWEKFMRGIGNGLLAANGPLLDSITRMLNAITGSGVLDQVVRKLSGSVGKAFGLGSVTSPLSVPIAANLVPGDAKGLRQFLDNRTDNRMQGNQITATGSVLVRIISMGAAFLERVPIMLSEVWQFIADTAKDAWNLVKTLGKVADGAFVKSYNLIEGMITDVRNLFQNAPVQLGNALKNAGLGLVNILMAGFNKFENSIITFLNTYGYIFKLTKYIGHVDAPMPLAIPDAPLPEQFKPKNIRTFGDIFKGMNMPHPSFPFGADAKAIGVRSGEIQKALTDYLQRPDQTGIPDTRNVPWLKESNSLLGSIAKSTYATAMNTDSKSIKSLLLGGDGQDEVTRNDIARYRTRGGGMPDVHIHLASSNELDRAIGNMIEKGHRTMVSTRRYRVPSR